MPKEELLIAGREEGEREAERERERGREGASRRRGDDDDDDDDGSRCHAAEARPGTAGDTKMDGGWRGGGG